MANAPALWALAEEWLDEKQTVGRGLAPNTEAAYRRDLTAWAYRIAELSLKPSLNPDEDGPPTQASFERELGRIGLDDLSPDNVKRALASLAREGYAPASRSRMLAALRGFCAWLVRNNHLTADPTTWLENPAPAERLPVAFLASELRTIVETVSTLDDSARFPWPARDRAMVAVLAGAGLRATELASLTIADVIHEADPLLRVVGKGNKERRVPISHEVLEAIDEYFDDRAARIGKAAATAPAFVRYNGRAFTRESINYHVYRWLARAGVHKPDGEAAHAFRHTYAKGLVARGVPISSVQQLLGHANLDTTAIYLRMTGAELHDAARAAEVNELLRAVPLASG